MNENQMLRRIADGDSEALVIIIERYSAYVQAIASNITIPPLQQEDVEEVAADVFLKLWNNAKTIEHGKLKAWLAATTRNCAKNRLRNLHQSVPLEDDYIIIDTDDMEEGLLEREMQQAARQAVAEMEEPDRTIFQRYYFLYQKTEDIAKTMELTNSAVKTRLFRGREKLKKSLSERGYYCEVCNS